MSLLDRISQRKAGVQAEQQAGQEAAAAEAAMPDAVASSSSARKDYGSALASGPDRDLAEEPASPEEQQLFTQMERALAEVVYGEKASRSIVDTVMKANDPVEGVGKVAHDITDRLAKKFPNASEDVLFGIGQAAVEQVTELVESSSPTLDLSEDQMAEAFSIALTSWMENNPGGVDGDMMQYMAQPAPAQL